MIDPDSLAYGADGLVPAIIRDGATGAILMFAWMNREMLQKTIDDGETWFWSRSRSSAWHKGATSGNRQRVIAIRTDCDRDVLLIDVAAPGPACHTGRRSCFGDADGLDLRELTALLETRRRNLPENSYSASLFRGGRPAISKKVIEEATEVILAAAGETRTRLIEETADLLFHVSVLMVQQDITLADVARELERRK